MRAVATSLWQGRVHLHLVVWWRGAGQVKGWLHCNGVATWLWTSGSPEDEIVYKGSFLAVAASGHQMGRLARVRSAVISRIQVRTHACLLVLFRGLRFGRGTVGFLGAISSGTALPRASEPCRCCPTAEERLG